MDEFMRIDNKLIFLKNVLHTGRKSILSENIIQSEF